MSQKYVLAFKCATNRNFAFKRRHLARHIQIPKRFKLILCFATKPFTTIKMKTSVYRRSTFNSAHRLNNPNWSEEKNKQVFGKCNSPHYHGHNYALLVKLSGEVDEETGYVMDLGILADLVKLHIEERFDHKNLNLDTIEFRDLNPTAENIARVIWEILRKEIDEKLELKVILYETERNFVEYPG